MLGSLFPKSMWVFVGEEDKSSVYHPEIVEMEIMILTALILLVNEVFSGSITDNFFFFGLYPPPNFRHTSD